MILVVVMTQPRPKEFGLLHVELYIRRFLPLPAAGSM
jgi:hypothetical protein